ncbi:regulatory protein RecX [Dehalogenimonas formicexedens]|uniref:regulatory protein RecX n=1 Tax=Dehalogenimonas formicexedens TaxID=1839801 RepID=UPI00096BC40D|nr:regulatory protein RecX [Dehalogenimonas formicexedens]
MPLARRPGKPAQPRLLNEEGPDRPPKEPADACYQAALKLLGYRARTESEMRQRLTRKGFGETDIELTLGRLKSSGLIDDAAFARSWSENRSAGSPRSAYIIKRELKTKGIDAGTADEAVSAIDDGEAAYRAVLPRLKRLESLPPEESRRKLADFLRRRGFNWNTIERTLVRLKAQGVEPDEGSI